MTIRTKARAVPDSHEWGFAGTGTEQVGLRVQAIGGELDGQFFTWYGFFTPAAEDRTLDSLRHAGWDGTDIINLPGIGSTDFELQLEEETDEDGNAYLRATFINRIGVAMRNVMTPQDKAAFAARMRSKVGSAGVGKPAAGAHAQRGRPAAGYDRPAQGQGQGQARPAQRAASNGGGFDTPPPTDDDLPFL